MVAMSLEKLPNIRGDLVRHDTEWEGVLKVGFFHVSSAIQQQINYNSHYKQENKGKALMLYSKDFKDKKERIFL